MMNKILSYHNDPKFKEAFVNEMKAHRKADQFIQGRYDGTVGNHFRGCHIGCSIHSLKKVGDHDLLLYQSAMDCACALGVPLWLVTLSEAIFESLPPEQAPDFSVAIAEHIPVGSDLNRLIYPIFISILNRVDDAGKIQQVQNVIALLQQAANGVCPPKKQWIAAAFAAAEAADAYASNDPNAAYAADADALAALAAFAAAEAADAYAVSYIDMSAASVACAACRGAVAWNAVAEVLLKELGKTNDHEL